MFIVTNREVDESKQGFAQFGDVPNPLGPRELRIVEATKAGRRWDIKVLPDTLTPEMKEEVGITAAGDVFCSAYVARKLRDTVSCDKRHVLFYVHGFNNDMKDVVEQCELLRSTYKMEVVAFSWPARGGGAVSGTLSYRRDKGVAQLSVGALDRTIAKIHSFIVQFNEELLENVVANATASHGDNPSRADAEIAEEADRLCPYRVSALFHSMGNYLFKHALQSSIFECRQTVFDNVVLAAADANNEGHAGWVDQISVRHRIFVTINEDDYALDASRMKLGDVQKARLGHYLRSLDSARALYVDFTDVERVGTSHSYFIGDPTRDTAVKQFFTRAFHGRNAESDLWYHPADKVYRFWGNQ